ncbi:hypothetical protein H6G41_26165 [Tolypothrix sp. FACHB-123]|uniref:hypothetical protein n=1 Tax=Tolypothrix sp. FACHB-123 TaxID=2692868 RepID=UPI0016874827|nr:hypothetical protein [Tolypothrix sp. FACHB-123]MBD2358055.1 hypothetical protein [Tolypothrix sp. FACHB-123]
MSKEIKNISAVELSEQEMYNVAGGVDVVIPDIQGTISQAINEFLQKELPVIQPTPPVFNTKPSIPVI